MRLWRDTYMPNGLVTFLLDRHADVAEMQIDAPNPDFYYKELELKRRV